MIKRLASLLILMSGAGLLAACSLPLPTNDSTAPPNAADFKPVETPVDPFEGDTLTDVPTQTKFAPQLSFELLSKKAGESPAVTISIYQTKGEIEIRETQTLIEGASFAFDTLQVGTVVGDGKMEIGTPPKMTLDVLMTVTSTNQQDEAQMSVIAKNFLAEVYVADLQVKQVPGGLSIISIGNATRANDKNEVFTTIASARVTQTLYPGLVKLPTTPGPMRTRTLVVSEPDPKDQKTGQKVFRPTFDLEG